MNEERRKVALPNAVSDTDVTDIGEARVMLLPSRLGLLEQAYSQSSNPSRHGNRQTTIESQFLPLYRPDEEDALCVRRRSPIDTDFELTSVRYDTSIAAEETISRERQDHHPPKPSHSEVQRKPRNDLVLQSLCQVWGRSHFSSATTSSKLITGIRLDQVLHMIDTASSLSRRGQLSDDTFILLTLTSFPFRILYAPPELKSLLQAKMDGEPLYNHLSPTSVLPTMSLADAESTPLPSNSTTCLLDGVFECQAEALPVYNNPFGSVMFFAIFIHDV
ncbi:hypothetical protein IV203_012599 [Nitzschia inconspicua]|uniref:Uncharacterized protein n=1 Tax=Nitzschia inconspicua TaxID=303405 RepID=A0A9K3KUS2_9STRA|nr:hypothetical protein IV203_012599 [Nitzschia inconspicua]